MEQVGDDREKRGFLPAMLSRGRREGTADLAVELALEPEAAGTIPEARHLARHPPEARRCADDDAVIIGQLVDVLEYRMAVIGDEARGLRDFGGRSLGDATDVDFGAGAARALGDGIGHRREVAVGRIIENQNLGHDAIPLKRLAPPQGEREGPGVVIRRRPARSRRLRVP
jgi:hypothetical protein